MHTSGTQRRVANQQQPKTYAPKSSITKKNQEELGLAGNIQRAIGSVAMPTMERLDVHTYIQGCPLSSTLPGLPLERKPQAKELQTDHLPHFVTQNFLTSLSTQVRARLVFLSQFLVSFPSPQLHIRDYPYQLDLGTR